MIWVIPVLLALLVNQNVLQNGLGWDDDIIIKSLRPPEKLLSLVVPQLGDHSTKVESSYYRPLVFLSYYLDYFIWGRRPFGFHLSVWAAHILNTALFFFIVRALFKEPSPSDDPPFPSGYFSARYHIVPLISASLFAVHPAHAEAVAWIAGRNDVFCATFALLSFLAYLFYHRRHNPILFALSMGFFLFALLAKEVAVGLVALVPAYEILATPQNRPVAWKRVGLRSFAPTLLVLIYFGLRFVTIEHPFGANSSDAQPVHHAASWIRSLFGTFGYYLKIMIDPYPHHPFIGTVPTSGPVVIFGLLASILLAVAILHAFIRRDVAIGVGLIWGVVTLAPALEAAIFNIGTAPLAERYVYLPSVGFLIAAVGWVVPWVNRRISAFDPRRRRVWAQIGMAALIVGLSAWSMESWHRNRVWRDPVTFWTAAAESSLDSGYPHRALGVEFAMLGKAPEAEASYRRAIAIDERVLGPDHTEVASSLTVLGVLYGSVGRYSDAEATTLRSLSIWEKAFGPDHPNVGTELNNLGVLYRKEKRYPEAEQFLTRSLSIEEKTLSPDEVPLAATIENLAMVYAAMGRYDQAEPLIKRAVSIWKRNPGPGDYDLAGSLQNYASLLQKMNRRSEAVAMLEKAEALRGKPDLKTR